MRDAILVINAGSSSVKFSLFAEAGKDLELVARGQLEGTTPRRTSSRRTPPGSQRRRSVGRRGCSVTTAHLHILSAG